MSDTTIKHKVIFWAESPTEWHGRIEPFDDGPNWNSRMIEMEHVARTHGIAYSRAGSLFKWKLPMPPTQEMLRSLANGVNSKWYGMGYKFVITQPKPEFMAAEPREAPEPITTSEPDPIDVDERTIKAKKSSTTVHAESSPALKREPTKGLGDTLTGAIHGKVPLGPEMLDEFAALMDKYKIDHLNLHWKKYT